MQMTPDIGPSPVATGSPEADVGMHAYLSTNAGTVNTAGCSQAPGSPIMQVCFLCMTKTLDLWFTTHLAVLTVVDICS